MSSKERRLLWIHFDWEVVFPAELFFALSWSSLFLFALGVNRQLVTAYLSMILSCKFICHGMTIILRGKILQAALVSRTSGKPKLRNNEKLKNVCDAPFFNRMNQGIYGAKPLAESTKFRSSPHRPGSIQRANHHCHNSYPSYKKILET